MKFTMTVTREEEVEIPDLSPDLVQALAASGFRLRVFTWLYHQYDEIYAVIEVSLDADHLSVEEEAAFYQRLEDLPAYQALTAEARDILYGYGSYFESCAADGLPACRTWAREMKRRYPDTIVYDDPDPTEGGAL
jgi:hypothetical protein